MKNFVQRGDTITVAAPAATVSGAPLLVGSLFGVCSETAASGASVDLVTIGVFDLPLAAGPVTVGAPLYWDDTAKKITTISTSNTKVGIAIAAAAGGASTVRTRLNGSF
jgi:predicted RecA/RadA family phage recombinase